MSDASNKDCKTMSTDAKSATPALSGAAAARVSVLKVLSKAQVKGKGKLETAVFRLPVSFTMLNTGASTCAAVLPVDVTSSAEWTSLQALYDEYRFLKGKMLFQTSIPTTAGTENGMVVMAFDPSDNTALSNVRNGCELTRHKLFAVPNVSGAGGSLMDGKPLEFDWATKLDEALIIDQSGAVSSTPGQWKKLPTAGSNAAYDGYLKTYNANTGASAAVQFCGILTYWVELRSRA